MQKELICHANYKSDWIRCIYDVERVEYEDRVEINLYMIDKRSRFVRNYSSPIRSLCHRVEYKNIHDEYRSRYLNWYNLFFCSNCYRPVPDDHYLRTAVSKGLKTASMGFRVLPHSKQGNRYKRHLPDYCGCEMWGEFSYYVYTKGSLDALFDIEKIKHIYEMHGLGSMNWDEIQALSKLDLSCFNHSPDLDFSVPFPTKKEHYVLNGLVLGYPVESTVALLNHTQYCYPASYRPIPKDDVSGEQDEFFESVERAIEEQKRAEAASAVYNVVQDGRSDNGLLFRSGERFRVLEIDEDTGLIQKVGGARNKDRVSLKFLRLISEFK